MLLHIHNMNMSYNNFYEINFKKGESKQIDVSLQIQNRISEKIINRSGSIILESDYNKIYLPRRIFLNERGFAKILLKIDPPSLNEQNFFGLIKGPSRCAPIKLVIYLFFLIKLLKPFNAVKVSFNDAVRVVASKVVVPFLRWN